MRRWLRIALIFIAASTVGVVVALTVLWQASRQVPDFYRQAIQAEPRRQADASDEMLQRAADLSTDVQQPGEWNATFTAEQINGWLAVDLVKNHAGELPPSVSDPRVAVEPGRLMLACRYRQGRIDTVVSLELDVYVPEPNVLALRIRKVRAGALPLPLGDIPDEITEAARSAGLTVHWRQTNGDPVALVSIPPPDDSKDVVELDSVRLSGGKIEISGHTERGED